MNAKCKCIEESGDDHVVAIKDGSFSFLVRWGMFDILLHISLAFITAGTWLILVFCWNLNKIINPPYRCNKCGAVIKPDQFI